MDIIKICKILWFGFVELVLGIQEHGAGLGGALAYVYVIHKLAIFWLPPLLLHPTSWVLLALARGASFIGCFGLLLALFLLFLVFGTIAWVIWHREFEGRLDSREADDLAFFLYILVAGLTLYVESVALDFEEGSETASFLQKFCK